MHKQNRTARKRLKWLVLALATITVPVGAAHSCPCNEITIPDNPHFDAGKGIAFEDTDQYRQEIERAVAGARAACEANHVINPAIVADIDETVLDNREEIKIQLGSDGTEIKSWNDDEWNAWVSQARARGIAPVIEFLRWAKLKGFHIFLITARETDERPGTELNLKKENIPYDELFLKPAGAKENAEDFKTHYRTIIEQQGYTIVCNIGDQQSDLYGLHSIDCEKLPNLMYFTR